MEEKAGARGTGGVFVVTADGVEIYKGTYRDESPVPKSFDWGGVRGLMLWGARGGTVTDADSSFDEQWHH